MRTTMVLVLATLFGGDWEPSVGDGEIHEKQGTKGDWHLYIQADPFGDPEGWFAATPTVDGKGEVRFECAAEGMWAKMPMLTVYTDGLGRERPTDYAQWEPMRVELKVDGGQTVAFAGMRPNHIATMDDGNDVVEALRSGGKAVLRFEDIGDGLGETISGKVSLRRPTGRKYVFAVRLDGFREASAWVMNQCGWSP